MHPNRTNFRRIPWQTRKILVRTHRALVPPSLEANIVALHAKARATPLSLTATAAMRSVAEISDESEVVIFLISDPNAGI
jgi:hypothetical protein